MNVSIKINCRNAEIKKTGSFLKRLNLSFFLPLCCLAAGILIGTVSTAQTFPTASSCTSGDLILDGAILPPNPGESPCKCGGTRALKLSIKNKTGSTRTSFAFWGTLKIYNSDGTLKDSIKISDCFSDITSNTTVIKTYKDSITFACGESLKITDLFLAWTDANKKSVCPLNSATIAPKCGTLPEIQVIAGVDATITPTAATCTQGGTMKVSPFGGLAPYSVTLKSGATIVGVQDNIPLSGSVTFNNLAAGDYTITIADSRPVPCTIDKPRTIVRIAAPAVPTSGGNQSQCEQSPIQTLTATATAPTGASVVWYDAASGGNAVGSPTKNTIGSVTYYAASKDNTTGCESSRIAVTLTIKGAPAAPSTQGAVECAQNPIQTLTATATVPSNGSIIWYNAATSGNTVSNPTRNTIGTSTYYAEAVGSNDCHSLTRTEAVLTIKATPSAPALAVVNNCNGSSTLTASALDPNATLAWSDGGNGNPRSVGAGSYTLTQTVNGCTSAVSNTVTAAPKTTPSKPIAGVLDNCNGTSTLTVTGLADGVTVNWTDDVNNHSNPRIVSSAGTYTATQSLNGCTSQESNAVTAAPKDKPGKPTADVVQSTCSVPTGTITVNSGTAGLTFSINSTDPSDFTNTNGIFSGLPAGDYTIRAKNADGCISDGITKTITEAPAATPAASVVFLTNPSCSSSTGTLKVVMAQGNTEYDNAVYEFSNDGTKFVSNPVFAFTAGQGYTITVRRIGDHSCTATTSCPGEVQEITNPQTTTSTQRIFNGTAETDKMAESKTRVTAYPNPYNDKVKFLVTSLESGKGSLEVYNMLGQKIKTVYQGQISAGSQSFEMSVPVQQRSSLIYVLKIGDRQVSGKLLQMNQ